MGSYLDGLGLGTYFRLAGVLGKMGAVAGVSHGGRIGSRNYSGPVSHHIVSILSRRPYRELASIHIHVPE